MVLNIGGDVLEEGTKGKLSNRSGTEYFWAGCRGGVLQEGAKENWSSKRDTGMKCMY